MSVKIKSVEPGSIAAKKGICPGDTLLSVNGNEIKDVLDYRFHITEPKIRLELTSPDGKRKKKTIRKAESDDIGLEFETYLMDRQHSCKNKCIFCFVDQLPPGMRESLYFKDDDDRLSFLFGNYVTLTNLDDEEVERLIKMHISPINISVHTMNPGLRVKMMKNPCAGECLSYINRFAKAGLSINSQLVLCPGINDGEELEYSLRKLFEYYPAMRSIACVPVGLTKHRSKLHPIEPYTPEQAGKVIDTVDRLNEEFRAAHGEKIAYASDEFYLTAGREMPGPEYYDDFPQLDNGVGMWALLKEEFTDALEECEITRKERSATIVTGTAAYPLIKELAAAACEKIDGLSLRVIEVKNNLFGESVTVSGLISGKDISASLEGVEIGDELLIPPNCLRSEGDMFIDSMTVSELEKAIGAGIRQSGSDGKGLLLAMIGE